MTAELSQVILKLRRLIFVYGVLAMTDYYIIIINFHFIIFLVAYNNLFCSSPHKCAFDIPNILLLHKYHSKVIQYKLIDKYEKAKSLTSTPVI